MMRKSAWWPRSARAWTGFRFRSSSPPPGRVCCRWRRCSNVCAILCSFWRAARATFPCASGRCGRHLDWSHNLLDPEQQKLFRRMSVFVGGATHEAIEAVCNAKEDLHIDLLDAIESLVDNSLVRRTGADLTEPRFVMLETMREYGLGRLAEAGEESSTRARLTRRTSWCWRKKGSPH